MSSVQTSPERQPARLTNAAAVDWYRRNRVRTRQIFDLLTDDAYYVQPIALRHPIVFYDGHIPAFSLNTLVKRAHGRAGIDDGLERLFARGIDPDDASADSSRIASWPDRATVKAFVDEADALVLDTLAHAPLEVPGHPLLHGAQAPYTILEHEAMHQETLLYMLHRLPYDLKQAPPGYTPRVDGAAEPNTRVSIPRGRVQLGAAPGSLAFGWDNEFGAIELDVPAFAIDRRDVTTAEFLRFVESGGYTDPQWWTPEDLAWLTEHAITHPGFWAREDGAWSWRGMFQQLPLPPDWPVYVSHAEACAYARWSGGRLPTEADAQRAAYGAPDGEPRRFPWGDAEPTPAHGVFDFGSWDPQPVDTHPAGRSAWGVDDLVGNGWKWTSTTFAPFPGFVASGSYPEYSADFFDDAHVVMKGASPVTARELLRPTFRNWFRPRYPYVYATFRCVGGEA
ncbi:MAG: SUMF1/EgtB/PvdO family nonheme iron enzyme [Vicinamibacterales bacterium]